MFSLFTVTDTANVYVIENTLLGQWHRTLKHPIHIQEPFPNVSSTNIKTIFAYSLFAFRAFPYVLTPPVST